MHKIMVEMHCHSTFSDGEISIEQLAEKLHKAGVKYATITDHDTLKSIEPFKQAISKYGMVFFTGVELTTIYEERPIHILAYGFDAANKELLNKLDTTKMVLESHMSTMTENFMTTSDAIKIVHDAGGIAILAHPHKTEPNFEKLTSLIEELHQLGLDGIEAIYASDSQKQREVVLQIAKDKDLVVSAGSDCHSIGGSVGIEIDREQWEKFRDAIMKFSMRSSNKNVVRYPKQHSKSDYKWSSFILNIILPAALSLGLFIVALFSFLLPYYEQSLLERKRENIRDITKVAMGVLEEANFKVQSNQLTLEQAQELAKNIIQTMRYGKDGREYFWLQDLTPRILMHPYRPDLNNQDVSQFKDLRNVKIFVEFVNLVREKNEGFISYVWQWNDEKNRLEAKESYIKLFENWNWIIGTGMYDHDVKEDIATLKTHFINVSLAIVCFVFLLLIYLLRNGLKLEKSRINAEKLLYESIERYSALTEAATEGALFISKSRCIYANAVMYELLGCNESHLVLLEIDDIFPNLEANKIWRENYNNAENKESKVSFGAIIKRCDGKLLNCNLTIRNDIASSGSEYMLLVRRNVEGNEFTERKLNLNKLLQLPKSISSDLTEAISKARRVDDIAILFTKTQELAESLLENAASSLEITRMLSNVTDATTKKLIEMAIKEIGEPPTSFVFLGLGSHGRESQTLFSDQDNAIIYRLDDNMDNYEIGKYFHDLANSVCGGLEVAGYRKCSAQKMANNPNWCQPLHVWKQYFEKWIKYSKPEDVLEFSIFFDFRAVAGEVELANDLRNHISTILLENPLFFTQLARNALNYNIPIRLFGTIVTSGGKEHQGKLDIKEPMMAIVSFARLYALKENILEANTLTQLEEITRKGIILDSARRNMVTAYEALLRLRLWNQVFAIEKNQELSNWIDPGQLGHIEEVILKECFKVIEILQKRIERDFFAGSDSY